MAQRTGRTSPEQPLVERARVPEPRRISGAQKMTEERKSPCASKFALNLREILGRS
jgi:hypothetical protein